MDALLREEVPPLSDSSDPQEIGEFSELRVVLVVPYSTRHEVDCLRISDWHPRGLIDHSVGDLSPIAD